MVQIEEAIARLLEAGELPWYHLRDTGPRHYDLRSLIQHIWLMEYSNRDLTLGMRLRCDPAGTGRPEQVGVALGISDEPELIHRTKLILAE